MGDGPAPATDGGSSGRIFGADSGSRTRDRIGHRKRVGVAKIEAHNRILTGVAIRAKVKANIVLAGVESQQYRPGRLDDAVDLSLVVVLDGTKSRTGIESNAGNLDWLAPLNLLVGILRAAVAREETGGGQGSSLSIAGVGRSHRAGADGITWESKTGWADRSISLNKPPC